MRTIFTNNEIKNIIKNAFLSVNETIQVNEEEQDLFSYLNCKFYTWRNRIIEKDGESLEVDSWLNSLNYSINESYALVEVVDSTVLPSQDIDNATVSGRLTFLIQTDKLNVLDYYVNKARNEFMGIPQDIQNSFGETIKAYINIGILLYDEEPIVTPMGETAVVSLNFNISYLTDALSYTDTPIYLSLDGTNYLQLPYTKASWQNVFTGTAVTLQTNPTRTGTSNSNVGQVVAFSFYDFNKPLTTALNDLFWDIGAYSVDGTVQRGKEPNIVVWVKVESNGKTYIYQMVITSMQKDMVNGDFNTSTICLKVWGKS